MRLTPAGTLPGFECVGGLLYNYITASGFGTSLNVRDTFAPSMLQQDIISPNRNYTGFLTATYDTDFFGNGQLYAELLATRRKSQQNGQRQFTLDYTRIRNPSGAGFVTNPLIAAGLGFTPPVISAATGIRVFADYGIYDSRQTQDFVKASAGFRGDLPFAPSWRYDLYGAKSWSDGTYQFEQILADRLAQSMDVRYVNAAGVDIPFTTPGGTFVCRQTAGGCVAAPPLTAAIIGGQFRTAAPAWFDYVTEDVVGHTKFREWTANLTVDGPLFRLPGRRRPGGGRLRVSQVEHQRHAVGRFDPQQPLRLHFGADHEGFGQRLGSVHRAPVPDPQGRSVRRGTDLQRLGPLHGLQVVRFGHDLQDRRSLVADPLALVPRQLRYLVPCAGAVRAVPGIDDGLPGADHRPV